MKNKCVTFSFDDGHINDIRLSKLFNKYNIKCTFNISDALLQIKSKDFDETYIGHEIACHGAEHKKLTEISDSEIIKEITVNKSNLENMVKHSVIGHAYAGGYHDERSINVLKKCGIVYARTTINTGNFGLPTDFLRWNPTCHFKNAHDYLDEFLNNNDNSLKVFYIWGHSYELKTEDDWNLFEELLKRLTENENIWFATNIEVYNFINSK